MNDDELDFQELVESYKEHLGAQANEIVVLKTIVKNLKNEVASLKNLKKGELK